MRTTSSGDSHVRLLTEWSKQKCTADLARSNQSLRKSEDYLQLAIDTIPGLVWTSLPDGHLEYLNRRWLDYTGMKQEDAKGWGWQMAIHPDDLPGLAIYWNSILAAGIAGEYEARMRRSDGRGFDPNGEHEGLGLIGMKERVDRMGGRFILRTQAGHGTEILIVLHHRKE